MTLLAGCRLMQCGCHATLKVRVAVASQPSAFVEYELCSATLTVCFLVFANCMTKWLQVNNGKCGYVYKSNRQLNKKNANI